jgi:hypothetical protein
VKTYLRRKQHNQQTKSNKMQSQLRNPLQNHQRARIWHRESRSNHRNRHPLEFGH